jgi:hypothetical protein
MGCFGAPLNEENKKRYCQNDSYNQQATRKAMIQAASADTFGFDCVCLIKGILWGWSGDVNKSYGGAIYASNGVPDISTEVMITKCSNLSTDFTSLTAGELLWMVGHVGIYIGDGLAVECSPAWANKVQITAVKNIGTKSGYNARTWTKHGKLPYIDYQTATTESTIVSGNTTPSIEHKVGDVVTFKGSMHYTSSYASAKGNSCKSGKAKITAINQAGTHPYHLVAVSGGGSTVYGWVNASDIEGQTSTSSSWTPAIGDTVLYNGSTQYVSANATAAKTCKGGSAKITQIYQLGKSKHPYHLIHTGSGCTVYGWVDAGSFTKV